MATRAYVLIETSVGKTKEVVHALQGQRGIVSVDAVTGPYDVIVIVEQPDLNTVGTLIGSKVHTIAGVVRTMTCLAVEM